MSETTANKVIQEIKQVIDITSRVDERVKIIAEKQQHMNERLEELSDEHNKLVTKVHVLESNSLVDQVMTIEERIARLKSRLEVVEAVGSPKQQKFVQTVMSELGDVLGKTEKLERRVEELEHDKKTWGNRVSTVMSYVWQGTYIICVCYLLYKLGLNNPPIP